MGPNMPKLQLCPMNGTQDLRFEYIAVKRIMCMLDAFTADDLEAGMSLIMVKHG